MICQISLTRVMSLPSYSPHGIKTERGTGRLVAGRCPFGISLRELAVQTKSERFAVLVASSRVESNLFAQPFGCFLSELTIACYQ